MACPKRGAFAEYGPILGIVAVGLSAAVALRDQIKSVSNYITSGLTS